MWMKTAKVSIQDKYLKTSFTKLSNIFSNLNEISRKIQQLPCKKIHLKFVCKMDHNMLPVSSDCVWDKIAAMFQTELWKKIQKLYKRKSIWKVGKMTATLSRPESVKTSWPKLSALYLRECASKFIFKSRCSLYTIWCNLKTLSVKWRSHCLGLTVLTYCEQFLVVSIWQSMLPNQIFKFRRNVNKILFSHYRLENGGHISRPQCANTLLLKQNSFCRRHLNIYFRICFTFAYAVVILKNEFESWSAKCRPYCLCLDVLTRCGRDKVTSILKTTFSISFLTSGEIWIRYKNLHTWNGSHVSAAMLWGRDKMVPLSRLYIQINFPVWNCFIFFFKFDLSVFLNFHTEIYCIILTSCSERGSNAVHRIWRH